MEVFNQKNYTCIVYPGVVNNVDMMLESLGGIDNISIICSKPNRRLEVRFRPGDVYCHSTCGDRKKTLSMLLKVKVKRKKNIADAENSDNVVSCEPIIMGRIETTYNFKSLCDFQYLPIQNGKNGVENIYPDLIPKGFPNLEWFNKSVPSFIPPPIYSRMDNVQMYLYKKETKDKKSDAATPVNIIGRTRIRRSANAIFVTFDVPSAPTEPRPNAMKYLHLKFLSEDPYQKLKKMFEERPVWSKMALAFETKFKKDKLKYLLPTVAYYFVTGPFRVMWVRIGYDPRKDPSSRIYQTLDYRLPVRGGLTRIVEPKRRSNSIFPYKSIHSNQTKKVSILKENADKSPNSSTIEGEVHYIFKPGLKLPARQIFYQYCDIKVTEVEEMFARLPKPVPDAECHRRRGWLPCGFAERVREIISKIVLDEMEKGDEKFSDDLVKNEFDEVLADDEDYDEDIDDDDDDVEDEDVLNNIDELESDIFSESEED